MRKINENYVYKEPEEITIQRNKIHKNQRNIEDFIELIEENSQEMKIQKLIKEDLSFMADWRSRMRNISAFLIILLEIKLQIL